jgi:hypothetical protein
MAQATQHTPGPWHRGTRAPTYSSISCYQGKSIADVFGSDEEAIANARLIAAAPELLKAAMLALKHLRRVVNSTIPCAQSFDDTVEELEAVIAKAS